MAKMLVAHASITPLNALSAIAEFPRERRKFRTSDTGKTGAPADTPPAGPALAEAVSEVVSGFLKRISAKGTVTFLRLTAQYEQGVNTLRNQAHTARFPVTIR
jgi:hypothetical protein